jgi:tRNA(Arg) A34 adenosine deaminase TadA
MAWLKTVPEALFWLTHPLFGLRSTYRQMKGVYVRMTDDDFMRLALLEAKKGFQKGIFPVGAVAAYGSEVIGSTYWLSGSIYPELLAAVWATIALHIDQRKNVTIYTTVQPSYPCVLGLARWRIGRVVYGLPDAIQGATGFPVASLPADLQGVLPIMSGPVFPKESQDLIKAYCTYHMQSALKVSSYHAIDLAFRPL